ncbi:hypothetical protein Tco_0910680 [Tanacetum coccineum]|uniref:Uncharacterized protein n=1 Tax=Tanacetum coccineum TaxID=301880 RepID=A0ABQ5CTK9_9ASTR
MKKWVDEKRRHTEFEVQDQVMVKLLLNNSSHLGMCIRGRYEDMKALFPLIERVGKESCRLQLPPNLKICLVFHVTFLKPYHGDGNVRNEGVQEGNNRGCNFTRSRDSMRMSRQGRLEIVAHEAVIVSDLSGEESWDGSESDLSLASHLILYRVSLYAAIELICQHLIYDVMEVIKQIDLNKNVVEDDNDLESKKEDVMEEDADIEAVVEEITGCMKTPKANSDWEPHIQGIHIPVEGTYIDVERRSGMMDNRRSIDSIFVKLQIHPLLIAADMRRLCRSCFTIEYQICWKVFYTELSSYLKMGLEALIAILDGMNNADKKTSHVGVVGGVLDVLANLDLS